MASTKFCILISVTAVLAAMAAPAHAAPIFSFHGVDTSRLGPNSLSSAPEGDFLVISAGIQAASTPDPISSLSVVATQGPSTLPLDYFPFTAPISGPLYLGFFPFAGAVTGIGWTIAATDSLGTSSVFAGPIANPVLLPLVTGITVSDTSTTPTVSWTLPNLTGLSVDVVELRIIDANSEVHLFNANLSATATSSTVPGGVLAFGQSYIYRVILRDEGGRTASAAFSGLTTVPEPGTLALMLAVLASIGGARSLTRAG